MQDRKESRIQQQAKIFRRLTGHRMCHMYNSTKSVRLKICNFMNLKGKIRTEPVFSILTTKPIYKGHIFSASKEKRLPEIIENMSVLPRNPLKMKWKDDQQPLGTYKNIAQVKPRCITKFLVCF